MKATKSAVLLCGFLGAGKTTLLRSLLRQLKHAFVIETELAINYSLQDDVAGNASRVYEFAQGCVCCSANGEFRDLVSQFVASPDGEQLVVELTGLSHVGPVAQSLFEAGLAVLTVAVVDGLFFEREAEDVVEQGLREADVVVVSKTDLISEEQKNKAKELARRINPAAQIVLSSLESPLDVLPAATRTSSAGGGAAVPPHSAAVSWCCASTEAAVDAELFAVRLEAFLAERPFVLRSKGIIFGRSGALYLQGVFHRVALSPAASTAAASDRSTRVSAIADQRLGGPTSDALLSDLQHLLDACRITVVSPKVAVQWLNPALRSSAVAAEQAAFIHERICASFPAGPQFDDMMQWMKRWTENLLHRQTVSFGAVDGSGTVLAVCICELFPDSDPAAGELSRGGEPIEEVLVALEKEVMGLATGVSSGLSETDHWRPAALPPGLQDRMWDSFVTRGKQLLHVGQIGCLPGRDDVKGLTRHTLRHTLRHCCDIGVEFAFAETSGPQSTALCVALGGVIVLTSFLDRFSSYDFVRRIPLCDDRNSDVVDKFERGRVPPVIRLLVWDLKQLVAQQKL